jgi:hypothetical protein
MEERYHKPGHCFNCLFRFKINDEIKAARKRRRRRIWKYVEEPMTKPTKIGL